MINRIYILFVLLMTVPETMVAQTAFAPSQDTSYYENIIKNLSKGGNGKRFRTIKRYYLQDSTRNMQMDKEAIDWFGFYKNLVLEKPGETDSIIYIVCHYDKLDGNIFAFANVLINGNLDIVLRHLSFTKGAYDNGSGVAISLGVLQYIARHNMHYTYRFLFAGMEEYGLRGSRRHVSGVKPEEWKKVVCAFNIDMVGKKGLDEISIINYYTDDRLMELARNVAKEEKIAMVKTSMPAGAASDFVPFMGQSFGKDFVFSLSVNLSGGLIPQRSYFTKKKEGVPVIDFTDPFQFHFADFACTFLPVSFGEIHSFKDKPDVMDYENLQRYTYFICCMLEIIDATDYFCIIQ